MIGRDILLGAELETRDTPPMPTAHYYSILPPRRSQAAVTNIVAGLNDNGQKKAGGIYQVATTLYYSLAS